MGLFDLGCVLRIVNVMDCCGFFSSGFVFVFVFCFFFFKVVLVDVGL